MELRHIRSFVAVATSGSITKAAHAIDMAQPAVSQQIMALESELGVVLFARSPRGVSLTPAGLALLAPARALLAEEQQLLGAATQLSSEARAEVHVSVVPSVATGLMPLALGLAMQGRSKLKLRLYERPTAEALSLLAARVVEMAVVRDCSTAGVEAHEILKEPLVVVVPPNSPVTTRVRLKTLPFLMFDRSQTAPLYRATMDVCARAGFIPTVVCEGAEASAMGAMIAAGIGAAVVPWSIYSLWPKGSARILPIADSMPHSTVAIVTLPGHPASNDAASLARALKRAVGRSGWLNHEDAVGDNQLQ